MLASKKRFQIHSGFKRNRQLGKKKGLGKVGERGEWCSTTLVEVDLARVGATYEGVGEYECSLSPEVC